jgi:WD40 repeat protein
VCLRFFFQRFEKFKKPFVSSLGSFDKTVRVWNLNKMKQDAVLDQVSKNVNELLFDPEMARVEIWNGW